MRPSLLDLRERLPRIDQETYRFSILRNLACYLLENLNLVADMRKKPARAVASAVWQSPVFVEGLTRFCDAAERIGFRHAKTIARQRTSVNIVRMNVRLLIIAGTLAVAMSLLLTMAPFVQWVVQ